MNTRQFVPLYRTHRSAGTLPSPAPVTNGLLQRKCACGGTLGPTGECEECRKKRLQQERKHPELRTQNNVRGASITPHVGHSTGQSLDTTQAILSPRFRQDFSRVAAHAGSQQPVPANRTSPIRLTYELPTEEGAVKKYSNKGVLMTLAGSGTCINGGAESGCDPDNGAYTIYANHNTCCTKDCSWLHEQTHVSDITSWGCCKALSVAYNAKGADKGALVTKYNDWLAKASDLTECHAYTNGVACADQLARTKNCAGAGRDTDCCKDIAEYRTKYAAKAKTLCDRAPKNPPPCPAF